MLNHHIFGLLMVVDHAEEEDLLRLKSGMYAMQYGVLGAVYNAGFSMQQDSHVTHEFKPPHCQKLSLTFCRPSGTFAPKK